MALSLYYTQQEIETIHETIDGHAKQHHAHRLASHNKPSLAVNTV